MAEQDIDAKQAIRLVLALGPSIVDETVIREVLGERSVSTISDVALAFGVKETTVRNTWRRGTDRLPGESKKGGRAKFVLADCLLWYLRRQVSASEARGADEFTKRKREAETRAAEAEARIKERRAEAVEGEYVPLAIVRSVNRGVYNRVRDGVLSVPPQLTPMFPRKHAAEWTDEVDRLLRNVLKVLSEIPDSEYLERIETEDEGQ